MIYWKHVFPVSSHLKPSLCFQTSYNITAEVYTSIKKQICPNHHFVFTSVNPPTTFLIRSFMEELPWSLYVCCPNSKYLQRPHGSNFIPARCNTRGGWLYKVLWLFHRLSLPQLHNGWPETVIIVSLWNAAAIVSRHRAKYKCRFPLLNAVQYCLLSRTLMLKLKYTWISWLKTSFIVSRWFHVLSCLIHH